MRSYEHLDLLLGQALECIDEASGEIKGLSILKQKDLLKHLGHSIVEIWEVRNAIYEIKPEIRRDFVTEYSNDPQRYEGRPGAHTRQTRPARSLHRQRIGPPD